jgi:lycopene cyclase CruA
MQQRSEQLATRYPHLTEAFSKLPQGDLHLRRLQDLNASWQTMLQGAEPRSYTEVVVTEKRATLPATDTFDIIYAGGGLNLLNAAVMTSRYGLRVLVFDRFTVGAVHREWNISRDELQELLEIGLLSPQELEEVTQREYSTGLVRFHASNIKVPASELHLKGVLDVAIDADRLTALCIRKIQTSQPASGPNVILSNTSFERCAVQPQQGATVDVSGPEGPHSYAARLLIDGMGSTSPIACQLNCGRPYSLVCPTVGTVARGYKEGSDPDAIDPAIGEVLVTTEDAHEGRQLIWEAFPGRDDQVAIYLFHYAESGDKVDLLDLFENFFKMLPAYKDTTNVEIIKPVYGFIPAGYNISLPWQNAPKKVLAYDYVLSLGDSAAFQSPLTFCGFGSYVRNLRRITTLLKQALDHNCLRAEDLDQIRASEAVPAVARAFSKFMIARPEGQERPEQVNETLNIFCRVLNDLGAPITNAFFKDRIGWWDYTRLVVSTPAYYPGIYRLAFKTLSLAEGIGWVTAWLQLGKQAAESVIYQQLQPFLHSSFGLMLTSSLNHSSPRRGLRFMVKQQSLEQVQRGSYQDKKSRLPQASKRGQRHGLWPQG